jgi:erythromycin esterase-like protein
MTTAREAIGVAMTEPGGARSDYDAPLARAAGARFPLLGEPTRGAHEALSDRELFLCRPRS